MADITYEISPTACDGGNHFDVTVSAAVGSVTYRVSVPEMKEVPTKAELVLFSKILLRGVIAQLPDLTHATARDRLHNLAIDISPRPAP